MNKRLMRMIELFAIWQFIGIIILTTRVRKAPPTVICWQVSNCFIQSHQSTE